MEEIANTGSPIQSFIEKTKAQITQGIGDWELKAPVDLEISAIVRGKAGGELDIQVVNFGAKIEGEQVQKIKLSIGPKDPVAEAEKQLRNTEIKYEKILANHRVNDISSNPTFMKDKEK